MKRCARLRWSKACFCAGSSPTRSIRASSARRPTTSFASGSSEPWTQKKPPDAGPEHWPHVIAWDTWLVTHFPDGLGSGLTHAAGDPFFEVDIATGVTKICGKDVPPGTPLHFDFPLVHAGGPVMYVDGEPHSYRAHPNAPSVPFEGPRRAEWLEATGVVMYG